MSPLSIFWSNFLLALPSIVAWFGVPTAALVVLSFTPAGHAVKRYLKEGRQELQLPPVLLEELALTREQLGEVLERLDFLERVAQQRELRASGPLFQPRDVPEEPGVTTPV